MYFDNDLAVVSGEDSMAWYKLREDGLSIRLVATCCHSTMALHHPWYQNIVMVVSDTVNMDVGYIGKFARGQMKDFPKERIGELLPLKNKPVDKDNLDDWGDFASVEELFTIVGDMFSKKLENRKGRSTQEMIDSGEVICLGFKEYDELL